MSYNFLPCDRTQAYLLPPSLTDWLPDGHLAWFVLDAVEQMDLQPFYRKYRTDGVGNSAFDPSMMVALLLYAYCTGERSSRRIERLCQTDVAYKVLTANQTPDHCTINRFRKDNESHIITVFLEILRLCVEAVFGQIKDARGFERFMRRGLAACRSEWTLICATHNLLKLWRSGNAVWN